MSNSAVIDLEVFPSTSTSTSLVISEVNFTSTRQIVTKKLPQSSDRKLRSQLFVPESFAHPANLNLWVLPTIIEHYTRPGDWIADPMAGVGTLGWATLLQRNVILREVEPKWVAICQANAARLTAQAGLLAGQFDIAQHDARQPWNFTADHLIFSPPYGCQSNNQSWDSPEKRKTLEQLAARPGSAGSAWRSLLTGASLGRAGYMAFDYGKHPDQIGSFRGSRYWQAMRAIYRNAHTALKPGGYMIVVIKGHIRGGVRVETCQQTTSLCEELGFSYQERLLRPNGCRGIWQRKRKEQGLPVIEEEEILIFKKPNQLTREVNSEHPKNK